MTLQELRTTRNLTRRQVAERTNRTETYILMLETGKRNPSDNMKMMLAEIYKVKPTTIFLACQQTKCLNK